MLTAKSQDILRSFSYSVHVYIYIYYIPELDATLALLVTHSAPLCSRATDCFVHLFFLDFRLLSLSLSVIALSCFLVLSSCALFFAFLDAS